MNAKSGDRIVMLGKVKRAAPNERAGVVEEVLGEHPPRYLIRWDKGRSTVPRPLSVKNPNMNSSGVKFG